MPAHIDTIPVLDAYREGGECPLCSLRDKTELGYVDAFLGPSVMEPDARVEVNRLGFCHRHFGMLYAAQNRLGLALMAHTHLKESIQRFEKAAAGRENALSGKRGLFGKPPAVGESSPETAYYDARSCVLCGRLSDTMERYAVTVLHLWKHDGAFRQTLEASKGLCLVHFEAVMAASRAKLRGEERRRFEAMLTALELDNLKRIEKELEWFTLKFDYRNTNKPWGDSKDAVERALNKLVGKVVGEG